jgi:pyruvate dehydrogenase (quinone)
MNCSDFIVQRLSEWGIARVFGYPGDGINPLLAAINRSEKQLEFIQTRHENMASFMACAHAKFTGDIGVCMATAGPGAIQLLNGLYDAKMDHQPVLAIVGQQPRSAIGTSYLQDVDLQSLFKDVAHEYVHQAMDASQLRHLIDRSIRIAKSERTVTCIIIPNDVQSMPFDKHPEKEHGRTFSGVGYSSPRIVPASEDLQKAANILNSGQKVAILVGAGALRASQELIEVANILGAGIAKALLGKAVVSDYLPFVTGSIGVLGTDATKKMMAECDTLLMVGSNFPYSEFLPKEGQARGVQIDIDARNLSLRYPMDVSLEGDSKETLSALIPLLEYKTDRTFRGEIEFATEEWWKVVDERAKLPATPINPQIVFSELSDMLPERAILSADSGTATVWFARNLKVKEDMLASVSGGLASMGCAVPYAVAAKFAYPERVAIAMVGDGAMQMSGINELITISKYWQQWIDPRLVVIVLNNRDLNFVTWEMRAAEGDPKFEASQDLPDVSYARFAESIGLDGITVARPEDVAPALEQALRAKRPTIVDVYTDPNVPPLPPQVTMDQAKAFVSSMLKGDPDTPKPLLASISQALKGIFHR